MKSFLSKSVIRRIFFGIFIGDSYGAGPEMKSHEFLTQPNILKSLDQCYMNRESNHGIGFIPGNHTDDTEMTIGVYNALIDSKRTFTIGSLKYHWNKLYLQTKINNNGIPRVGYGSWKNVAEAEPNEMEKVFYEERKRQSLKDPGNAPNMRQLPILIFHQTESELWKNITINVLASHPHPKAVISCLAMTIGNKYLLFQNGKCLEVINVVIDNLKNIFNNLDIQNLLESDEIYQTKNQNEYLEQFIEKLKKINSLPEPFGFECKDIDYQVLAYPFPKPLGGKKGLAARADLTALVSMFMIKWSGSLSVYENLKRTICFGGDTDSLACTVLPIVLAKKNLDKELSTLFPEFILRDLEGYHYCMSL